MKAVELVEKLSEQYAGCRTYLDRGTLQDDYGTEKFCLTFTTFFQRARLFRFDWQQGNEKFRIGSDGLLAYERYPSEAAPSSYSTEIVKGLEYAVAGSTGISHGVSAIIIGLLATELSIPRPTLLEISDLEIVGRERILADECYLLQGSLEAHNDAMFWIATTDYRLLQIQEDRLVTAEESREVEEFAIQTLLERKERGDITPENFDLFYSQRQFDHKDFRHTKRIRYEEVSFNQDIMPFVFQAES